MADMATGDHLVCHRRRRLLPLRCAPEQPRSVQKSLGITILVVEQNANLALEVSNYGYVLETGRVILHDKSRALRANEKVKSAYLGG
jgi:branched-chain amino acid transport system ATP-binding protein